MKQSYYKNHILYTYFLIKVIKSINLGRSYIGQHEFRSLGHMYFILLEISDFISQHKIYSFRTNL